MVVESLAALVAERRPDLEVRIGYLEHGTPHLREVAEADCVVVPVLLSSGIHVRRDIPAQAPDSIVAAAIGPDRRIAVALAARLRAAGWRDEQPLVLAAAGSADSLALADVHQAARELGEELGVEVTAAFVSAGEPRLAECAPAAVASYLLAPGHFADVVARCGSPIVTPPLGADPAITEIILDRYDTAVLPANQEV